MKVGKNALASLRSTTGMLVLGMCLVVAAAMAVQIVIPKHWDRANLVHGERELLEHVAVATAASFGSGAASFGSGAASDPTEADLAQLQALGRELGLGEPVRVFRLADDMAGAVAQAPDQAHADALVRIASSDPADPADTRAPYRPDMAPALFGATPASTDVYAQDGHDRITGWAPIRTAAGEVVAIVETGRPFAQLAAVHHDHFVKQLLMSTIAGFCVMVIMALILKRYARGFRHIEAAAIRLGKGDLKTPIQSGAHLEVATLARALDAARVALLARAQKVKDYAIQLAQQRDLAVRGIGEQELRRRAGWTAAEGDLEVRLVSGESTVKAVRLADLTYTEAALLTRRGIALPAGAPVRLFIRCEGEEQDTVIRAVVRQRVQVQPNASELILELQRGVRGIVTSPMLRKLMNGRDAMRVEPKPSDGVACLVERDGIEVGGAVRDISDTGMSLVVKRTARRASDWGTTLSLRLQLPDLDAPLEVKAEVVRVQPLSNDPNTPRTRLGMRFHTVEEGASAAIQHHVLDYVTWRYRADHKLEASRAAK